MARYKTKSYTVVLVLVLVLVLNKVAPKYQGCRIIRLSFKSFFE